MQERRDGKRKKRNGESEKVRERKANKQER